MKLTAQKRDIALTRLKIYWKTPQKGQKYITFYSVDAKKDLISNNQIPGIKRLEKILHSREFSGRYKFALLYDNHGSRDKIVSYNQLGQRETE